MKRICYVLLLVMAVNFSDAQSVKVLTSGTKTSLRGLSAVTDNIVWASGSNGTVAKSTDGGETWKWFTVKGFEKTDFRDIEAFDENNAIIMGIDAPAHILKTTDGGETWKTVYKNETKGMFLDAMDFSNERDGVVIGDPIDGRFFITRTTDGGNTWQDVPMIERPMADSGEACFASSGTNIRKMKNGKEILVTGGIRSHFYKNGKRMALPILQGKESTGANSVAVKNKRQMIVVGGDFNTKDSSVLNCLVTYSGGKEWFTPAIPPGGYRSCVEFIENNTWITCGLNGTDISVNNGREFRKISKESFHACRKAKKGKAVFFSGGNGRIGSLE